MLENSIPGLEHPSLELLQDFAAGRLSPEEGDRAGEHLDRCEACALNYEQALLDVQQDSFVHWLHQVEMDTELGGMAGKAIPRTGPPAPREEGPRYAQKEFHAKGGLGQVYRAIDQRFNREVAIKEMQSHLLEIRGLRERFEREAVITAQLNHPGIVPVHDMLRDAHGAPQYVMKFIRGQTLRAATARFFGSTDDGASPGNSPVKRPDYQGLEFRGLLQRLASVCQTIQFAHSRGVVHRDLKPQNLMLGDYGETLVVDWGMAKGGLVAKVPQAADTPLPEETQTEFLTGQVQARSASKCVGATSTHSLARRACMARTGNFEDTAPGLRIGTPAYMSPEQARADRARVGPATDIYGLGATLYSLLTNRAPFSNRDSAALLADVAAGRFCPPQSVQPSVPRPLDAICRKAMALAPENRYESAGELADDLTRYLADEPVTAEPDSIAVKVSRWQRKHPRTAAVLAATLLMGLTSALLVAAIVLGKNAELKQANEAETQARQDALAARRFLEVSLLARARPAGQEGGLGVDVTLREAIDASEPKIASTFANSPLEEASLRNTLGLTYIYLREAELAIRQLERARELRELRMGPEHADTLESMNNLGAAYKSAGKLDLAIPLLEQTLELRRARLGPEHADTLATMNNLAMAFYSAGQDRALPLLMRTLELRKARLGPEHVDTLQSMDNLATAYRSADKIDEAIVLHHETLGLRKSKLGLQHPNTLASTNNLALAYKSAGKLDLAIPLYQQALELIRAELGWDHPHTLVSMNNLATALVAARNLDDAIPLLEQTLELRKARLGTEHPETLNSMNNLASAYHARGDLDLAVPLFEQSLEFMKVQRGLDHPATLSVMNNLASAYRSQGKLASAIPLFERTLESTKAKLGQDHADTLQSMNNLAMTYLSAGRPELAVPLFSQLLDLRNSKHGPDHPETLNAMGNLAGAYLQSDQREKALPHFDNFIAGNRKRAKVDDPDFARLLAEVSTYVLNHQQFATAESYLRECHSIREKTQPGHWATFHTKSLLGAALAGQKKYEEAEPWLLAGFEGLHARQDTIPAAKASLKAALKRLVDFYTAWGKPETAAKWQAEWNAAKAAAPSGNP